MKKKGMILLLSAMAIPVLAQQTNEFQKRYSDGLRFERNKHDRPDSAEWTDRQRKEHQERKYRFMDKSLTQIGVSEEDRIKIRELQDKHRGKMKNNMQRSNAAREKLSKLQDNGATEAELDAAIENMVNAQAEQIKILVRNRMEMEKILGKEKYARFMESARTQFRQHGRRGGSGLPPRPDVPPKPKSNNHGNNPPYPKMPPEQTPPPAPE